MQFKTLMFQEPENVGTWLRCHSKVLLNLLGMAVLLFRFDTPQKVKWSESATQTIISQEPEDRNLFEVSFERYRQFIRNGFFILLIRHTPEGVTGVGVKI